MKLSSRFDWLEFREAVLLFPSTAPGWSVEGHPGHPSQLLLPLFGPLSKIFFGPVWIFVPGADGELFAVHRDLYRAVDRQDFVYA